MDQKAAIQVIDKFLRGLKHTGVRGFEGFVADLVQRATGQEFRLASSGRQSGSDAASETGYSNRIKIETKHYGKRTRLKQRELIAEIGEAAASDPTLDIWVLAASRPVDKQISDALDAEAHPRGVEVLLLDLGINDLPRLAVLMAAYPARVIDWAKQQRLSYDSKKLRAALSTIAKAPDFAPARDRLLAKLDGLTGYDTARRRIHSHLLKTLSDARDAQDAFRQPLGLMTPDAQVIRRVGLNKSLDEWWDVPGAPQPAVALGEEGTGKTWAVFDWALGRADRGDMPILLPFAAVVEELSNSDPAATLLPRLLAKWTRVLDEFRWKRRLDRWVTDGAAGRPLILLIADGLSERAAVNWRPFFTALLSDPWRERIAVLATDRPYHWRTKCSLGGLATFTEISVNGYSDAELDQALSSSPVSGKAIPPDLLPLISIPRYCRIVVDHYQEMVDAADFTRERLIYLEVKDRRVSKTNYPLTDEELFEIIRGLAERARANPELKPEDLRALITVPGGDEAAIYEEIAGGGLLEPVSGSSMTPRRRVEPLRLVFGFGMLLAEDLADRSSLSSSEIREFLTSWFEPQSDMDLKVDICGSAMFHALFQDVSELALRELIRYWLGLRNWADTAQSAFTMYVLRRPGIFADVAEEFWSSTRDSGAAQEFLGTSFTTHRDDPRLQPVLVNAIGRWMGFVHPAGRQYWNFSEAREEQMRKGIETHMGRRISLPSDGASKAEQARTEIETRAGRPLVEGKIEIAGVTLTVISDGALLRLSRFGLMIMSAGDPSPFIHSLVCWALASAIMGHSDFGDLVAWVIRLSERDVDDVLAEDARRLLARSEATASAAARILLVAVGNRESKTIIEEYDLTSDWSKEQRKQHALDPCKSSFEWTESESLPCLGREDVSLQMILSRTALLVSDPSISIPDSLVRRSKEALRTINPATIYAGPFKTAEGHHLETLIRILCAHAPSEIAAFIRAVVGTMPDRDLAGQYFTAIHLPELSLLLSPPEVAAVSRAIDGLSKDAAAWSLDDHGGPRHMERIAEARAFNAIAPHLNPSEFFAWFTTRPVNAWDLVGFELWFAPVPNDQARKAIELLHTPSSPADLRRILWALPHLGVSFSDTDRSRLAQLAASVDSNLRAAAMRVALITDDGSLGRRIVDLGRSADGNSGLWEELWLPSLLARFGKHLPFEELAQRLRPSAIGFVLAERGNRPKEIEIYAGCLDREWQRIVSAVDPGIERLPEIEINDDPSDSPAGLPELRQPMTSRTIRFDPFGSWRSGDGVDPAELKGLFGGNNDEETRRLNEDLRRKVDAIRVAWRTDAFQWYGRTFSVATMDLLYQHCPALVERWVQPAVADSLAGAASRVRLGSFLDPICRVLLNRKPELGLQLWKVLRKRENNPIVLDAAEAAFSAGDSSESNLARGMLLDVSWDDDAIARIGFCCEKWNRRSWLDEAVEGLVSAGRLWKRAKGLTLASYAETSTLRFEELITKAEVNHTWVELSLRPLRENVRKNHLARYWYSVFLTCKDTDAAWGALRLGLALADERLLNWRVEIEKECATSETAQKRLRFLSLGWDGNRDLSKDISRENARKELLFGLKIQRGEIFPFM